jgi:hypothetical protein
MPGFRVCRYDGVKQTEEVFVTETMTGGCQCGRIRYAVAIENDDAYWCHCRMCQKATGGIAAAFVEVPIAAVHWLSEPDWYESSPVARRPFCSTCGTPLI